MTEGRRDVAIYLWPNMFMLDALVPHQILGLMPELNVYTFARTTEPIASDTGMKLIADYDLESVPQPDILVVGGGANPLSEMADEAVIGAIRRLAGSAELVTSVCDGALILAQAGLLNGYRATTHWAYLDLLRRYPGIEVCDEERVVSDRSRMTGGGCTSALDFSFALIAAVISPEAAAAAELVFQYEPQPLFGTGSPAKAPPELVEYVLGMVEPLREGLEEFVARATVPV
ncbi:MAG TPA: DJ-1/PfpI family protein [Acidimicrobiia bacterium]|jgi:transcriptional regulator GlxA family with amidase domain|nr:DJ-1/PfpI family protein [Acidimicrobiia bacterium]